MCLLYDTLKKTQWHLSDFPDKTHDLNITEETSLQPELRDIVQSG